MDRQELFHTPSSTLEARRAAVCRALGSDVMILSAAPVLYASRDTDYPYRPDSDLFYLTGVTETSSVAVMQGGDEARWVLFTPPRDSVAELWAGPRLGPERAMERYAPDACHPNTELEQRLPELLAEGRRIHYRLGADAELDGLVRFALERARSRGARTGTGPRAVVDPGEILDELRLRKDEHEVRRIRAAAELTLAGHRAAAAALRPGVAEWRLQAELEAVFQRGGGRPGFGTIVGSGRNACVLHYRANDACVQEGQLVLVDAGAELGLYNGDVTRTYPASGRFSAAQRKLYDLVERGRAVAVRAVRPGVPVAEVHDVAVRMLVEGLVELGILAGEVDARIQDETFKEFFPHQTSHWLGLDVHDPGDYARDGASRVLEPGMVLTVEPGLYVRPDAIDAAEPYRGLGVRLEDDVLVTDDGHENLTAGLPSAAEDVEAWMETLEESK